MIRLKHKAMITALGMAFLSATSISVVGQEPIRPKLFVAPNEPLGKAQGAVPGRVAWVHSPEVAQWTDCPDYGLKTDGTTKRKPTP